MDKFYEPVGTTGFNIKVNVLKAYSEGGVGWAVGRVELKLSNGVEFPLRHMRIFQKEKGIRKIVHNHISIAVPNESIGE